MLTVNKVAKLLDTTPQSVYRWIKSKELKAHIIGGGLVRIYEADLDEFIHRQDKKEE